MIQQVHKLPLNVVIWKKWKLLCWRNKESGRGIWGNLLLTMAWDVTILCLQWLKYCRPVAVMYVPTSTIPLCEDSWQQQGNSREYICRTESQTVQLNTRVQKRETQRETPGIAAWEGKSSYQHTSSHFTGKIIQLLDRSRLRTRKLSTSQEESPESWKAAETLWPQLIPDQSWNLKEDMSGLTVLKSLWLHSWPW